MYKEPVSGYDMTYDKTKKRYILTEEYVRDRGIDLNLILDTSRHPEPSKATEQALDRVSMLVYSNIYRTGNREKKQFMLACDEDIRDIIKEAMIERLRYIQGAGDLSTKSGAIIESGVKIGIRDLQTSIVEEMILKPSGLLHPGPLFVEIDRNLDY